MRIEDIALTMTPSLGTKGVVHLLNVFGDARSVFAASAEELAVRAELRPDIVRNIVSRTGWRSAEREIEYCRKHGITPIASTDTEYPFLLRETDDYPHILYVRGDVGALARKTVTFVGTRRMTSYGERMCTSLVAGLAELVPNVCIVSGLAFGIDGAAHRAALASGVVTVGVVANALPEVTPAQHTDLARDIVEHGGAIISELPSCTKQNGSYYIARNRIMAGLGCGTVIVESYAGGGSLTTVNFADGYGRTVMAVAGRATDKASEGTNHLIRNRKAQLILSADDIVSELMWELDIPASREPEDALTANLSPDEAGLLGCFRTSDPVSADELAELSGLTAKELAALLVSLELEGVVRQLPGNRYEKLI